MNSSDFNGLPVTEADLWAVIEALASSEGVPPHLIGLVAILLTGWRLDSLQYIADLRPETPDWFRSNPLSRRNNETLPV